jgi:hypothetical protein
MRLKSIKLPKSERFAATVAAVRAAFGDIEPLAVYFGALGKSFHFDARTYRREVLAGPVVASLEVAGDQTAVLQFYPVSASRYSDEAATDLRSTVLPRLNTWLLAELGKPATAILGSRQLVVEWKGDRHELHDLHPH